MSARPVPLLPWLAAGVLVAGLLASTWVIRAGADRLKLADRLQRDLAALGQLAGEHRETLDTLEALRSAARGEPADLGPLLDAALPGTARDIREVDAPAPAAGVAMKAAEVTLKDVALDGIAVLVAACEAAMPPWRIAEMTVTPSGEGRGRVVLVLETVLREGSS